MPTWHQIYELVGLHLEENAQIVEAPLVVSFIDVGQGDCTFIKTKEADILIDAGESESAETVLEYLDLYNVDDLEYIIATHPHSDHVGALPEIMEEVKVENFVMGKPSSLTCDGEEYIKILRSIAKEKGAEITEVAFDSTFVLSVGKLNLNFLGPLVDDDNLNNTSLIVRVTFGEASFLFTGDAEKLEEYTLVSRDFKQGGATLKSDVLKVPHHGSNTSSTPDFIEAVNPKYAVISCGADNVYGHPHNLTVQTLTNAGAQILRTDLSGSIVIASDGKEILLC